MGLLLFMMSSLSWTGIRLKEKNLYIYLVESRFFQAFEPYLDEVIVTQIHARVEGDTYFPEEFDLSIFETVSSKSYTKDEKNPYDFTINTARERKSNGT